MPPNKPSGDGDQDCDRQVSLSDILSGNTDIESLAFIVLSDAAKSAQEDLKQIMAEVKAVNAAKRRMRELLCRIKRDVVASAVAHAQGEGIAFSPDGLGDDDAYRRVELPIPDAESPTGVQVAVVSLVDGRITSKQQIEAARDAIKNQLDSMSELGEMESLRLQLALDRMSKLMSTLSNVLKKISDTGQSITQNLK